jgi:hypothetical protein
MGHDRSGGLGQAPGLAIGNRFNALVGILGTEALFEGAHLLLDIVVHLIGKATLIARGRFLMSLHDFPNVVECTFSGRGRDGG